jgi:hypothetical protein
MSINDCMQELRTASAWAGVCWVLVLGWGGGGGGRRGHSFAAVVIMIDKND